LLPEQIVEKDKQEKEINKKTVVEKQRVFRIIKKLPEKSSPVNCK
jgi:hypothetical protein